MTFDPYKGINEEAFKQMRLSPGWIAVKAILPTDNTSIIANEASADYRNCLYHVVIATGPECKREPGEFVFVLGNTLSAADPSFQFCFMEDVDVVASWS